MWESKKEQLSSRTKTYCDLMSHIFEIFYVQWPEDRLIYGNNYPTKMQQYTVYLYLYFSYYFLHFISAALNIPRTKFQRPVS